MIMAAVTTTSCGSTRAFTKSSSSIYQSEKDDASINEAFSGRGRPRNKETTSSYIGSSIISSAKCNSSCIPTISSSSSTLSSTPPRSESVVSVSDAATRTVLPSTTRSLPVSFQGESFFFQTKEAKPAPRKPAIECREANVVGIENSQSDRWPATRAREPNSATSSLDCFSNKEHSLLVTVQFLHQSLLSDEVVNFNIGDRTQSLNSEIVSSGSSSSSPEPGFPAKVHAKPPGICIPARFRQENGCPQPQAQSTPKMLTKKQQTLSNTQLASSRFVSSPPSGPVNSSSPKDIGVSRIRRNIMESYSNGSAGNAPSIISFASEVRRRKKGESRIEDAHLLRLFHNRYLQWRYINARAENTISTQMMNTQNKLYYAWMTFSELHGAVMNKQVNLQVLRQNLKLASILMGQIVHLEKWYTLDEGHEISFKGAIDALKASTLRLPVIGGAKVDIKEVKDAVNSAVGVLQSLMVSVSSLLSKVERISSLVSEFGKLAAHEEAFLNHCRDLISIVAALHVKQSSLQSYMLQLRRNKK
ncbi:QWRF motif-containing protein 2 [Dendrobium catenatum]|uniref:QWRF motif-containing protein 2 n=1 Tax=Dendrobium catenatum TaxID=906689 RepID=A0A2I0X5W8_9ASPA|nr:QWRF motif-containing protein 2 [Dendrobium catenatum]PKU83302.1 hypothetical protein MA16_Dca023637 [Dendrobium catenatum]